jgi:hypothetical protein
VPRRIGQRQVIGIEKWILEPSDILNKHAWLFRDGWVEESADEIEEIERIYLRKREERIKNQRTEALREIMAQRGLAGILELSERGKLPG